jgi:hypothetical protein|tara:strand:- start:2139 stop:2345 length:207 start_codon:yes stop_codon:yes gene_type:complete
MARRTTRRQIRDDLDQARKYMLSAEDKLAVCTQKFFDGGVPQGAQLDMIREGIVAQADLIARFRSSIV